MLQYKTNSLGTMTDFEC